MITVCRQHVALGRVHAGRTVRVHVSEHTLAIELDDETRTIRRTTTQPVFAIKGSRPRQPRTGTTSTELSPAQTKTPHDPEINKTDKQRDPYET